MRLRNSFTIAFLALSLFGLHAEATMAEESRQSAAAWLSHQLHRSVDVSQILAAPVGNSLEGCAITHVRPAATGDTSLVLRCPAYPLPQLVLLHLSLGAPTLPTVVAHRTTATTPMIRAGMALRADWRTAALHAQLPVVALDSGANGAEIRVRVANTSRIMRARVISAHAVSILSAGA